MGDTALAADAVEQHLAGMRAKPAGEDLAVVGEQLLRAAMAVQGSPEHSADGGALARSTSPAAMQNREWSSMPVTALSSRPSASQIPPMMSICHSSIGRSRSQRR
jgi:hypothetical protein